MPNTLPPTCSQCGADWTKPNSLSLLSGDTYGVHFDAAGDGPLEDDFQECSSILTCATCGVTVA